MQNVRGYCRIKLYAYPSSVDNFSGYLDDVDVVSVKHFDALGFDHSFRGWD